MPLTDTFVRQVKPSKPSGDKLTTSVGKRHLDDYFSNQTHELVLDCGRYRHLFANSVRKSRDVPFAASRRAPTKNLRKRRNISRA
jgi:hypothetical protein